MDLSEAMDMAINDERALQEKYSRLAQEENNPFVKAFLERIVVDAKKHEKRLRKKYEKLLAGLKKKAF
ncbi:MAG: hypothetical protein MRJ65_01145 [Candidatus Brocadiaceae bacterium]|nr:hypothetical protein [Candidatus Brocadiaceae bacterium]